MKYTQKRTREDQSSIDSYTPHKQRRSQLSEYSLSIMTTEERTRFYQQKYLHIMDADSQLKAWVKTNQQKCPPLPPPKVQHSLSQKQESPSPKSSFSTFLKKAIRPSESSVNKPTKTTSKKNRFSLTSSLNRLSLTKTQHLEEQPVAKSKLDQDMGVNDYQTPLKRDGCVKRKRARNIPVVIGYDDNQHILLSPSINDHQKQSVFLDRLQQRNPIGQSIGYSSKASLYDDSCDKRRASESMKPSFQRLYQDLIRKNEDGTYKSSTVGKKSRLSHHHHHALQNLAEKYKSTFNPTTEQKSRSSFSFASSLSSIRFTPPKFYLSKRQSAIA
ncbi:unnamed protein product [Rhizopus stolonifer]